MHLNEQNLMFVHYVMATFIQILNKMTHSLYINNKKNYVMVDGIFLNLALYSFCFPLFYSQFMIF